MAGPNMAQSTQHGSQPLRTNTAVAEASSEQPHLTQQEPQPQMVSRALASLGPRLALLKFRSWLPSLGLSLVHLGLHELVKLKSSWVTLQHTV